MLYYTLTHKKGIAMAENSIKIKNINNVIVALFDPQLDHISQHPSAKELAKWRPATALLSLKDIPIISKYILVAPKEHLEAAHRLIPLLENGIRNIFDTRIRIKDRDKVSALISGREKTVQIKEIAYDNIWDIQSCSKNLKSILNTAIPRRDHVSKATKAGTDNAIKKPKVIISLLGSTTAARTALYLTAKRLERESDGVQLNLVKHLDYGKRTSPTRLWIGVDNSSSSNGLLRQGVGTQHPTYATALDRLECVIKTFQDAKILITGPTGAGKSELARLIIAYLQALKSDMTDNNCISQNIAALAPTLIESELFGHEKASFTGADKQHIGIFERANNGILFLDEIGELPLHLQAKLLTILDGNPFTRVGGKEPISSRFLLLCGTNKDLRKECAEGRFRKDLYERLNTWHIEVPALKNRPDDIGRALQRELGQWEMTHKKNVMSARGARDAFIRSNTSRQIKFV